MKKILYILVFLPAVSFGILPAKTFPWAILVSIIHLKKVWIEYFFITLIILPSVIVGIFEQAPNIEMLRCAGAYYNGLILFFLILKLNDKDYNELVWAMKITLLISILMGMFQFFIDNNTIETITRFFIPRLKVTAGYKGVSGLSTEPGRQAIDIILIFSALQGLKAFDKYPKYFPGAVVTTYMLLINRSATGFVYLLIYFFVEILNVKNKLAVVPKALVVLVFFMVFSNVFGDFRSADVAMNVFSGTNIKEVITYLFSISGYRSAGVLAAYLQPTIFGFGIGNWASSILKGLVAHPYLYENVLFFRTSGPFGVRPMAFYASLWLESGLWGVVMVSLLVMGAFKGLNKRYQNKVNLFYTLPSLFSLFFLGYIGSPVAFVCIAMLIKKKYPLTKYGIEQWLCKQ